MNLRFLLSVGAASLVAAARCVAADQVATVTEAVNVVDHGSSQSNTSTPAEKGTRIHDGEYVKTGDSSRAEIQFANKTVSRLGSDTILNYSASANQVDLQAGTILFSKPKDGKQINIKTEAVTAAIVGTTGFMQVIHHNGQTTTLFGLIEGHANVTAGGSDPEIGPGQIIVFTPGAPPEIFSFDVPLFLKTSLLYKGFHGTLPNQSYIDAEIALYQDLVNRGFIIPPKLPYIVDNNVTLPSRFIPFGWDSAGNGLNGYNNGRIYTPPPPTEECHHHHYCCWWWCCHHGPP